MFPSWRRRVEWFFLNSLCRGVGVTIQPTDDHPLSVFLETDITPE